MSDNGWFLTSWLQLRTKELEQQLAEVKLKQQEELVAQEEAKSRLYKEQIAHQLKVEQDLRAQLALYGDKFEQFQVTSLFNNLVFCILVSKVFIEPPSEFYQVGNCSASISMCVCLDSRHLNCLIQAVS